MKKLLPAIPLLFILFLIFSCQDNATSDLAPSLETDIKAIQELSAQYGRTVSAGDVDGYISLFTDDGVVMPPNAEIVKGKEAVLSIAQSRFGSYKEMGLEEVTTPDEIHIFGDWAFDLGITSYKTHANPTIQTNKYIRIWRKQSDNSWKLARVIWNSNSPVQEE
jgi:uncharacterized protein (TIGR02246 family)